MGYLTELKKKWETTIGPIPIVQKPPPLQRSAWQNLLPSVTRGRAPLITAAPTSLKSDSHMAPPIANPSTKEVESRVEDRRASSPLMAGSLAAHGSSKPHTHLNDSTPTAMNPTIFIGNVPLRTHAIPIQPEGRFAEGFNNSSRKTLQYIQPEK
ncbi:UNVERIFIED_CONTAM: hypothetical protein Slati_0885600 [Sesamum latifolium]|uniref:Uncharacterized protein n=1 Tax=Sesamum latifolium TaxID=2727402 RepID=A0AAW2XMT9_9LAMI